MLLQHVAPAYVDEEVYLFVDLEGTRSLLKNEQQDDSHPFIKFINARNLPEFLSALDEIYEIYAHTEFIADLMGPAKPTPVNPKNAKQVASYFESNPSRSTIEKTRGALEAWHFDTLKPSKEALDNARVNDGKLLYTCMPLRDLIEARDDLRRTARLMAWLIGKCSFEMAHALTPGDKNARFKSIADEKNTYLGSYYTQLRKKPDNLFVDLGLNAAVDQIHLYAPQNIERTIRSYVDAAFSLMLSEETKKMSLLLEPYTSNNTILSAIWSFFATGLNKDAGNKAIGICSYCGCFFQQERQTKKFCSNSCRVMYAKKYAGRGRPALLETQTSRLRRKLKNRN